MQEGKNWVFPKEINANLFFGDSNWLELWKNHFCPSMGPNGGSVAMDSERYIGTAEEAGDRTGFREIISSQDSFLP
jgi:hypothetical protein